MEKTKKMWLLAVAATLVVGGISAWWFYLPIYTIQSVVKKPLLDPESAQFSNVKFFRSTGYGCGFVNARNKMGGYVGRKQFVASLDGQVVLAPTEKEPEAPRESPVQLPTFSTSFSMEGLLADSSRRLQEYADELRWAAEVKRIRAESEAFKALVAAKCS
jgi:hypothetical protein